VGLVIEYDCRRRSFRDHGVLGLADDRVLEADAGAADSCDANADLDRVGEIDLAAIVALTWRR
jgi:hypothetical protein